MNVNSVSLSTVDYVVAVVILLVPLGIGILYAVKDAHRATRAEYLLGGRQMSVLPVAMSMFVTYQSAISLIGVPSETFYYGLMIVYIALGQTIAYVIGYFTIVPLMYPLQMSSIYEYLELRYRSKAVRIISTLIAMLTTICYMAIALLSPALALEASAGIPLWMSIAVMGAIGTLYTAIGGIKSVVWTDAFQTIIIFIGIFTIITKACIDVGGPSEVWRLANTGERIKLTEHNPDPRTRHTIWSLTIGVGVLWLVNSFNQATLQRLCCMPTLGKAKLVYLLNIPLVIPYIVTISCVGLAIYAYFAFYQCEPLEAGFISNRNQLAPFFVLHAMGDLPGMAGLFISTLCCGSLSTLSSGINALAANTVEDILPRLLRPFKEATITFITKLIVVAYGSGIIGLTFLATSLDGTVTQMAMSAFGALGTPILGIFILGGAIPWINKYGALCGAIVSLAFNLWISIGSRLQGLSIQPLPSPGTEGCPAWHGSGEYFQQNTSALVKYGILLNQTIPNLLTEVPNVDKLMVSNTTTAKDTFFLFDISYEWYSLMGLLVCSIVGILVSFCTNHIFNHSWRSPHDEMSVSSRFIFPFLHKFWKMEEPTEHCFPLSNTEIAVGEKSSRDVKNGTQI